jgi:hypothetical protein
MNVDVGRVDVGDVAEATAAAARPGLGDHVPEARVLDAAAAPTLRPGPPGSRGRKPLQG